MEELAVQNLGVNDATNIAHPHRAEWLTLTAGHDFEGFCFRPTSSGIKGGGTGIQPFFLLTYSIIIF